MEIGVKVKDYLIMQIITLICSFLLSVVLMYVKPDDNEEQIMSDIEKTSNVFNEENKNEGEGKQKKRKKRR